jgi:hypothetical protein
VRAGSSATPSAARTRASGSTSAECDRREGEKASRSWPSAGRPTSKEVDQDVCRSAARPIDGKVGVRWCRGRRVGSRAACRGGRRRGRRWIHPAPGRLVIHGSTHGGCSRDGRLG